MKLYGEVVEVLNNEILSADVTNSKFDQTGKSGHLTINSLQGGEMNNADFQKTVLSAIANLQNSNDQILLKMQEILRYDKKIAMERLIAPDNLPHFPLKTCDEFLNFECMAKEDPIVNYYMIRKLAALGGSGVEGVTRRIMKFLLTNELGVQFNWKGRHNKISFEHTSTMGIVYEAAKLNFPTHERNDMKVAWCVKEWLKHSTTRINQAGKQK